MSEKEIQFLETLRAHFAGKPFTPLQAMEPFRLSELPDQIRTYLTTHGPGIGATKAMARWLADAGAKRAETKTHSGFLWSL